VRIPESQLNLKDPVEIPGRVAAGRVYRFSPLVLGPDELGLMHATDERVSLEMLGFMCRFFTTFIKTMSL
jgi:acetylornithine deacetylase/succinyl-diaminopimelate desuccinylase-like protein